MIKVKREGERERERKRIYRQDYRGGRKMRD